jgi:hypothetical protein
VSFLPVSTQYTSARLFAAACRDPAPNSVKLIVTSALGGQNRKLPHLNGKSVLPPEADIVRLLPHVRRGPLQSVVRVLWRADPPRGALLSTRAPMPHRYGAVAITPQKLPQLHLDAAAAANHYAEWRCRGKMH